MNVVRIGKIAVAAALLAAVVSGCGSVDEGAYVSQNKKVIETIPPYSGAKLVNSYSIGIPKRSGGAFSDENGAPYGAFRTHNTYRLPHPVPVGTVVEYYDHLLRAWSGGSTGGIDGCTGTYHRHGAELYLIACPDDTHGQQENVTQIYYDVDYAYANELK